MSHYIKLHTSFWNHRKTLRLRLAIGDDALWVPIRLWSYAAENQPDGDFSKYSSEELNLILQASSKHASSILGALKDAGFLTQEGQIHDWQDYNGYHAAYAERAKAAAAARWKGKDKKKTRQDKTGQDKTRAKHCLEHACAMLEAFSPNFKEIWESFREHRKAIKAKMTPHSEELILVKCTELGEERASAALKKSIEHGWRGVFEDNNRGRYQPKPAERTQEEVDAEFEAVRREMAERKTR